MSMHQFLLRKSHSILFSLATLLTRNLSNSGSDTHALTLFNVNGASINTIQPYTPFLTTVKTSPIACTSFHPHRMMLAVGSLGHGHVNVYTCVGKVAAGHDEL